MCNGIIVYTAWSTTSYKEKVSLKAKAGDTRNYHLLSALKIYSKTGNIGWLTTTYCNNRSYPADGIGKLSNNLQ